MSSGIIFTASYCIYFMVIDVNYMFINTHAHTHTHTRTNTRTRTHTPSLTPQPGVELLLSRPFVRSFFIFTNYIRLNNKVKKDIFTYRNIKNVCSERSGAGAGT